MYIKMTLVISFLVLLGVEYFQERGAYLRLAECIRDCGLPYKTTCKAGPCLLIAVLVVIGQPQSLV